MNTFGTIGIIEVIVSRVPWTLALSLIAFIGGGLLATMLTLGSILLGKVFDHLVSVLIATVQSTPLLMLMFLCFFGLPLLGIEVSAWVAVSVALIAFTSAFLAEAWRAAVKAVPKGQWEAAWSSGLSPVQTIRVIIVPQAVRIAMPATVGFLVQVVKATALASIVGFMEVTRAAIVLNNITFRPFFVFFVVTIIYMTINCPISLFAKYLERRLHAYNRAAAIG